MSNQLDQHVQAYQGENIYDFDNSILLNWYPKRILEKTTSAKSLLELGLGHGFSTRVFDGHFSRHVVLDGSSAVIDYFKKQFPNTNAVIEESFFESFQTTEKFDLIVFGFVLEHVEDPVLVLKHFAQFLTPGGRLFAAVPNAEVMNRRLGNLAGMLPDLQALSENDLLLGHKRYYTVSTFTTDIKSAGYEIISVEGIYLKPLATSQMVALNLPQSIIDSFCKLGIDYPELSCGILVEMKIAEPL